MKVFLFFLFACLIVTHAVPALGIGDIGGCLERHYFKGRQNYEKYNYEKYYYEPLKINLRIFFKS
mgnify:CR=1 FL=1